MPKINFAEVKGDELIPPGKYVATCVDAKPGTSSTGNDKIDLQWKIEGSPFDGRRVFDTLSFHPSAQFRIKQTMVALGHPKDFEGEVLPDHFLGRTGELTISIQESDKIDPETKEVYPPRNRVKKVSPLRKNTPSRSARSVR